MCPCDGVQVWKKGTRLRVDGTLKGVEENAKSMLPQWKRGHFSILFDGATTPNTMLLLDRVRGSYIDLAAEKKAVRPNLDDEASAHAAPLLCGVSLQDVCTWSKSMPGAVL